MRMAIVWSGIVFIYLAERLQGVQASASHSLCSVLALLSSFVVVFVSSIIILSAFQWKCYRKL